MSENLARVANVNPEDITNRRPYFQEGRHKVKINLVKYFEDRKNIPYWIVEAELLETTNINLKVDTTYAWLQKMNIDAGPPAVKAFVAAVMGIPHDSPKFAEIDQGVLEFIVSDNQPFAGKEIDLECVMITTKEGKPFTLHTWG